MFRPRQTVAPWAVVALVVGLLLAPAAEAATVPATAGGSTVYRLIRWQDGQFSLTSGVAAPVRSITAAWQEVLEIGIRITGALKGIRLSFWQDGLPIQSVPQDGSFRAGLPEVEAWGIG